LRSQQGQHNQLAPLFEDHYEMGLLAIAVWRDPAAGRAPARGEARTQASAARQVRCAP
jgi:hypothetical protein